MVQGFAPGYPANALTTGPFFFSSMVIDGMAFAQEFCAAQLFLFTWWLESHVFGFSIGGSAGPLPLPLGFALNCKHIQN